MKNSINFSNELSFGYVGWRYYNKIKKKAMSEDLSASSFALSLSIAFFIVSISAITMNFIHTSLFLAI